MTVYSKANFRGELKTSQNVCFVSIYRCANNTLLLSFLSCPKTDLVMFETNLFIVVVGRAEQLS